VDIIHIMRAFQQGADGVYVAGCLQGDCHFDQGNIRAAHRVERVKTLLEEIGISGERVKMLNMSAGMGGVFAQTAIEFTEQIRQLGPNPVKDAAREKARAAAGC
jgi:coenzyme F420-reducing hydrogenase delta subunit